MIPAILNLTVYQMNRVRKYRLNSLESIFNGFGAAGHI
jgi:hypothetical protein